MKNLTLFLSLTTALAINESAIGAAGAGARAAADRDADRDLAAGAATNRQDYAVDAANVAKLRTLTGISIKESKEFLDEMPSPKRASFIDEVGIIRNEVDFDSIFWPLFLTRMREIDTDHFKTLNEYVAKFSNLCGDLKRDQRETFPYMHILESDKTFDIKESPYSYIVRGLIENFPHLQRTEKLEDVYAAIQRIRDRLFTAETPHNAYFPYLVRFLLEDETNISDQALKRIFENYLCDFAERFAGLMSFEKLLRDAGIHNYQFTDHDQHSISWYFASLKAAAEEDLRLFPESRNPTPETLKNEKKRAATFMTRYFAMHRAMFGGFPFRFCLGILLKIPENRQDSFISILGDFRNGQQRQDPSEIPGLPLSLSGMPDLERSINVIEGYLRANPDFPRNVPAYQVEEVLSEYSKELKRTNREFNEEELIARLDRLREDYRRPLEAVAGAAAVPAGRAFEIHNFANAAVVDSSGGKGRLFDAVLKEVETLNISKPIPTLEDAKKAILAANKEAGDDSVSEKALTQVLGYINDADSSKALTQVVALLSDSPKRLTSWIKVFVGESSGAYSKQDDTTENGQLQSCVQGVRERVITSLKGMGDFPAIQDIFEQGEAKALLTEKEANLKNFDWWARKALKAGIGQDSSETRAKTKYAEFLDEYFEGIYNGENAEATKEIGSKIADIKSTMLDDATFELTWNAMKGAMTRISLSADAGAAAGAASAGAGAGAGA